jgi:hypothetical protein
LHLLSFDLSDLSLEYFAICAPQFAFTPAPFTSVMVGIGLVDSSTLLTVKAHLELDGSVREADSAVWSDQSP